MENIRNTSNIGLVNNKKRYLTLFRMGECWEGGGGQGGDAPTSFYPVTSTNVGISPQNSLTFSFNPFATMV